MNFLHSSRFSASSSTSIVLCFGYSRLRDVPISRSSGHTALLPCVAVPSTFDFSISRNDNCVNCVVYFFHIYLHYISSFPVFKVLPTICMTDNNTISEEVERTRCWSQRFARHDQKRFDANLGLFLTPSVLVSRLLSNTWSTCGGNNNLVRR